MGGAGDMKRYAVLYTVLRFIQEHAPVLQQCFMTRPTDVLNSILSLCRHKVGPQCLCALRCVHFAVYTSLCTLRCAHFAVYTRNISQHGRSIFGRSTDR